MLGQKPSTKAGQLQTCRGLSDTLLSEVPWEVSPAMELWEEGRA